LLCLCRGRLEHEVAASGKEKRAREDGRSDDGAFDVEFH